MADQGTEAVTDGTARRGGEPRRRPGGRSARVRAATLDAAFRLALERGPARVTVADVAERAGVHPTSIYRRWGDRDRLLIDALLSQIGEAAPLPDTGTLEADLRAFLRSSADFMRTPQGQMLARMAASIDDASELREARGEYWRLALANAGRIFERAAARGEIPPGTDPATAVEVVAGPLYMRALVTGEELDDAFVEAIVRIVLTGLRGRSPAPPERTSKARRA